MADYSIISDVSKYLLELMREKMCPEPVMSPEQIAVASPADEDTDYTVGLYLYDIQEEKDVTMPRYQNAGSVLIQQSPKPYRLYYMIYINGAAQTGLKGPDIQKIIGRAVQIVNDRSSVPPSQLQPWLELPEPPILLSQAKISLEEKIRIWQAVNKTYQISLFYQAAPVLISSEIVLNPPRVTEAEFSLRTAGEEGRLRE